MMEQNKIEEYEIENLRVKLQDQHIQDFLSTLDSPTDQLAERSGLIAVMSKSIKRLIEIEQQFVIDQIKDANESGSLCPSCLVGNAKDVAKIEAVAKMFNSYLDDCEDCED